MTHHRFTLQPYQGLRSRYTCPNCCHRNKTFKRYIDANTGNHLANHVGRCNRADKCGYHFTPRQYFADGGNNEYQPPVIRAIVPVAFNHLPASLLTESLAQKAYIHNRFILFLADVFGWEKALQTAGRYNIGTAKHWHGATVFWQVDANNRIRTGKIMLYDKDTGKRVKDPFNHVAWAHSLIQKSKLKSQNKSEIEHATSAFLLQQCFFGEHLLNANTTATVAIAESEKTAVMASLMMPQFIWLAAGSLQGLTVEKCRALKNRTVLLFPDVGAFGNWAECARTLNLKIPTATFTLHPEMERTATPHERDTGADMADRWIAEWMETKPKLF